MIPNYDNFRHSTVSSLILVIMMSCILLSQPVASKDLMIEFWSPNLDGKPIPEQFVSAGDTVTFKVYGPHTVYIHPTLSCDPTNRNELVPKDHSVTYTFQESDSGFYGNEMLFVCDAGTHCDQGQKVSFRVFPAPQPPSPAPTTLRPTAKALGTSMSVANELPPMVAAEEDSGSASFSLMSIGMSAVVTVVSILL